MSVDALDSRRMVAVTVFSYWDRARGVVDGDAAKADSDAGWLRCLECGAPMLFRGPAPSVGRRAAFAHHRGTACPQARRSSMSQEHRDAQLWVARVLAQRHPHDRVELEVPIDSAERGGGRGDVVVTFAAGRRLCIEVQRSSMTQHDAAERVRQRADAGAGTEWIFIPKGQIRAGRAPVPGDSAIQGALDARGYALLMAPPAPGLDFATAPAPQLHVAMSPVMTKAWKFSSKIRGGEMEVMRVTRSLGEMHATPGGLVHPKLRERMTEWLTARRAWLLQPLELPELTPPKAAQRACELELARLDERGRVEGEKRSTARKRAREAGQAVKALAELEAKRRQTADVAEEEVQRAGRARADLDAPPPKWQIWNRHERAQATAAIAAAAKAVGDAEAAAEVAGKAHAEAAAALKVAGQEHAAADAALRELVDVVEVLTPAQRQQRIAEAITRDQRDHEKALADQARRQREHAAGRAPHVELVDAWLANLAFEDG